jgi:hypothetical protein
MVKRWASIGLLAAGLACGSSGRVAEEPGRAAWLSSAKLDARTRTSLQSFLAFHYPFRFQVVLARPLTAGERQELTRSRVSLSGDGLEVEARTAPLQVEALLELDAVRRVSCSRQQVAAPVPDQWQERVNLEAAEAWRADGCWITGHADVSGALDEEQRQQLVDLGAHVSGAPPMISLVLPRDALPALIGLPFVTRFSVEPAVYPDQENPDDDTD